MWPQYNPQQQFQPQQPWVPQQPQLPQARPPMQDIVQVNGMDGAKAYQMPPNSRALLLDSNDPVAYIKTTDGAGWPTIAAYTMSPLAEAAQPAETLEARVRRLEEMLNEPTTTGNAGRNATGKRKPTASGNATAATDGAGD